VGGVDSGGALLVCEAAVRRRGEGGVEGLVTSWVGLLGGLFV
jgi:hypothetical protein